MHDDFERILQIEREWKKRRDAEDRGSHLENPSAQWVDANEVVKAARKLADTLLAWERKYDFLRVFDRLSNTQCDSAFRYHRLNLPRKESPPRMRRTQRAGRAGAAAGACWLPVGR